jgi:hypothetical protein
MAEPPETEPIVNVPLPNDAAPLLKVPKEEDNDAMRLWRATVHPLDNIGEPSSAEWGRNVRPEDNALPLDYPDSEYNNPPRWIFLEYPNGEYPISAQWIPGKKYEYGWSKINSGAYADEIPNYRVTHEEIPQYVPRVPRDPIPISELADHGEWLEHLVSETLNKGPRYIRNLVNSHVKPIHPFDADFTRKKADRIRQAVADILIGTSKMGHSDTEIEVFEKWSQFVPEDPRENDSGSDKMALDIDSLEEEMYHHNKMDLDEREEVQGPAEPAEPPAPAPAAPAPAAPAAPAAPFSPACYVWPPIQQSNSDNSYDGGSKRRHRVKSINKRSKRRGKSTKKRSKKRVNKSRKRQRRHK